MPTVDHPKTIVEQVFFLQKVWFLIPLKILLFTADIIFCQWCRLPNTQWLLPLLGTTKSSIAEGIKEYRYLSHVPIRFVRCHVKDWGEEHMALNIDCIVPSWWHLAKTFFLCYYHVSLSFLTSAINPSWHTPSGFVHRWDHYVSSS